MNFTCQKPTIGARTGATCGLAVVCALAVAVVAVVAFTGAECKSSAVAVLEVSGPSDAPHCALALTASRLANTSVANIVAIARTIPFIGSPLSAGTESQDSLAKPDLDCRRGKVVKARGFRQWRTSQALVKVW